MSQIYEEHSDSILNNAIHRLDLGKNKVWIDSRIIGIWESDTKANPK